MVDLHGQYFKIKDEVNQALFDIIERSSFINGDAVHQFAAHLQNFLNVKHVIPCANGTDALQIALMALEIERGAEIIVPSFSFVAPAEVIALLGFVPVFADVELDTFNISIASIKSLINEKTRAIIPVHLFGQCAHMEEILQIAQENQLYVIEDNAQSIGAEYQFKNNQKKRSGTMGNIGTTSFFPSKNLGCMGDGGAVFTNNDALAEKMKMICNHGQTIKYKHQVIGINSRLDSLQAAVLNVKIKYLETYNHARMTAANFYNQNLIDHPFLIKPSIAPFTSHVFNQYTLKVHAKWRNELVKKLKSRNIPTMIYYPLPLHQQEAFARISNPLTNLPNTEELCTSVISLPIHTELDEGQLTHICKEVNSTFLEF